MVIDVVVLHAERALMNRLEHYENKAASTSFLLVAFSKLRTPLAQSTIEPVLRDVLGTQEATIYFCHDGDIVLTWQGFHRPLLMGIMSTLAMTFRAQLHGLPIDQAYRYFEPFSSTDELVAICRGKLLMAEVRGKQSAHSKKDVAAQIENIPLEDMKFTDEQVMALAESLTHRSSRASIEILVVEDHAFSRKLFTGMIDKSYHCRMAENAETARHLYATFAPDICFIDIELGDANGHSLARLFRGYDQAAKLVMLSAHCRPEDIEHSQRNGVSAYVLKPYSRKRINEVLEKLADGRKTIATDKGQTFLV